MQKFVLLFLSVLFLFSCKSDQDKEKELFVYQDNVSKTLAFSYGSDLLTILNYSNENYKAFFKPVNSLNGIGITRGWPGDPYPFDPVDHPHQKGMWFSFGDVNGYDFWNNSDSIRIEDKHRYGKIITDSVILGKIEKLSVEFEMYCRWLSEEGEELIAENAFFRIDVYENSWSLKRKTKLKALQKIVISDNKEGLFAMRMAREFQSDTAKAALIVDENFKLNKLPQICDTGKTGYYTSSSGIKASEVWGTANAWVNLNARVGKDSVSVLMMDHPENFAHPPCWHARDYGLFAVNNFGNKAFNPSRNSLSIILHKDESLKLLHSVYIKNSGFLQEKEIRNIYREFIQE